MSAESNRDAAAWGRGDAEKALQRARDHYDALEKPLPADPSILMIVQKYATSSNPYIEDSDEARAYDAAWYGVIFTDSIHRLAEAALAPMRARLEAETSESAHVCDESCVVAAAAECEKHGMLGMADTERGARELTLAHLKSHHPRRAHHAIAKLTEELNQ